ELSDVFERISAIARKVLPHDALFLPVYLPDGVHARRYTSTGVDPRAIPHVIEVPEFMRGSDWEHHIVDDLSAEGHEGARTLTKLGFRSGMRVPVRLEGRTVAALAFM